MAAAPWPPPAGLQPGSGRWQGAVRPVGGDCAVPSPYFIIICYCCCGFGSREAVFQAKSGIIGSAAAVGRWLWGEGQVSWGAAFGSGSARVGAVCFGGPMGVPARCVWLVVALP